MRRLTRFGTIVATVLACGSAVFAQQAPMMPRAWTGFTIYFKKEALPSVRQKALKAIGEKMEAKNGKKLKYGGRQFIISLDKTPTNPRITVASYENRSAHFTLGTSKATATGSGSSDASAPITPAFVLQGLSTQLLVGFNPGDRSNITQNQGATLLSPGSSTQGVNLLFYSELKKTSALDVINAAEGFGEDLKSVTVETPDGKKNLDQLLSDASSGDEVRFILHTSTPALYGRLGLANYSFTSSTPATSANGTILSVAVGYQRVFDSFDLSGNTIQVGMQFGLTGRFLMGDIATSANSAIAQGVFGNKSTSFLGPEFTLYAKAGDVVPYARLTYLGNGSLQGFSGWQVVIGMDIFPKLFGGK